MSDYKAAEKVRQPLQTASPKEKRAEFEDWWQSKSTLMPAQMKEAFWLAFNDGWYRAFKYYGS